MSVRSCKIVVWLINFFSIEQQSGKKRLAVSVCNPWAKQSEQFIGVTISNRNHLFYNPHSLRMAQRAKTTMSNINNISLFFLDKILSLRYSQTKLQRKAKRRIHSCFPCATTHSMEKYEKFNHSKCICSMYNTHTAHTLHTLCSPRCICRGDNLLSRDLWL